MSFVPYLLSAVAALALPQEPAPRLLDHAALNAELKRLDAEHGDLVQLELVGTSRGEREILAALITGPGEAADVEDRPAILLVANIEGPRVFASAIALQHVEVLAQAYATDDGVRAFLDSTVLLIVPRANPDGAEARFASPRFERFATGQGVDDDRDGRQGEDPPSDVDGDGFITWMRVEDPDGEWIPDPTDARVLVEATPAKGERGRFKLHREGRDLDGDERVAEDAPRDGRVDRNFPSGWVEHEAESGLFATDEPEVRGLCELVLAHPEIALVLTYDGLDDLVEAPESVKDDAPPVKRVPAPGVLESDHEYWKKLGERYRELTESEAKEDGENEGSFQRWCYDHRGLWSLSAMLWEMPTAAEEVEEKDEGESQEKQEETEEEPKEEPSEDAKRLEWVDSADEAWRFVEWKTFQHPELGAVEVGGFAPYAHIEPPQDEWADIATDQLEFLQTLGASLPRLSLAVCEREDLGGGVWRVKAVLQNEGLLPLLSHSARRTRTTRPARVRLELPANAELLAGSPQTLVSELEGSGGRHELVWLVHDSGGGPITVTVDTDHAGSASNVAEVVQ